MATGLGQYGFGVKMHRYADAGKYFNVTNPTAGTGIVTGVVTSLAATTPYIVFKNNNAVQSGIKCYLDVLKLYCTVVGATFSATRQYAHHLDTSQSTTRYTSGAGSTHGDGLTSPIINTNADSINASKAQVYVGAITAAAAGSSRLIDSGTLCGAIEVVQSSFVFDFGPPQLQPRTGLIDNSTTIMHSYFPVAPVVVGPQEHYLFSIWGATMATGITFAYNLGWVEA